MRHESTDLQVLGWNCCRCEMVIGLDGRGQVTIILRGLHSPGGRRADVFPGRSFILGSNFHTFVLDWVKHYYRSWMMCAHFGSLWGLMQSLSDSQRPECSKVRTRWKAQHGCYYLTFVGCSNVCSCKSLHNRFYIALFDDSRNHLYSVCVYMTTKKYLEYIITIHQNHLCSSNDKLRVKNNFQRYLL